MAQNLASLHENTKDTSTAYVNTTCMKILAKKRENDLKLFFSLHPSLLDWCDDAKGLGIAGKRS